MEKVTISALLSSGAIISILNKIYLILVLSQINEKKAQFLNRYRTSIKLILLLAYIT